MASLRWIADGIEAAEAAGGITLESYHRPGFTGGRGVRRSSDGISATGFEIETDPDPYEDEAG